MRTSTVLSILLTCSVILNVILWWKDNPAFTECYATSGFEAPSSLTKAEVQGFVLEYGASITAPNVITGGVISRSTFDEMLCIKDCNAVTYSFALDAGGKTGPGDKGVFLIVSGAKVTCDDTGKITSVDNVGSPYYFTRHWCPPSCMPL